MSEKRKMISTWRIRTSSQAGRTAAVEASSDRSRIVFSEAFRMLHRKAQVFSLDDAGTSRTRLTHSLEVSQVGRYLTQLFFEYCDTRKLENFALEGASEIVQSFVESACLVHDIGNPPFGHFGETAICHWFEKNSSSLEAAWTKNSTTRKVEANTLMQDFLSFDGNPQGFRILTRLIWGTDQHSLNLTATQLASSVKYNTTPSTTNKHNAILKKAGYFHSEKEIASKVFDETGVKIGCRHPFVYLMEAADDIAYCLSDIEDALKKEIFSELDFLEQFKAKTESDPDLHVFANHIPVKSAGKYQAGAYLLLKTKSINTIVRLAATQYAENFESYYEGKAPPLLDEIPEARKFLEFIKDFAKNRIYCSRRVLQNELIGSKVISGILDRFLPLLIADRARFEAALSGERKDTEGNHISFEYALLKRIPNNYLLAYRNQISEPSRSTDLQEFYARAHLIVDYLCGLTDDQAVSSYKLLCSA